MIITKIYIGNAQEAFIESNLSSGLNVIFSNDNHVGKTVVMQAIMYALGSDPLFSSTLKYKEYYFIIDIDIDGKMHSILRQRDSFVIKNDAGLFPFDTVSEFRKFWSDNILPLPSIIHNGEDHIVYPDLYNQMFFTSQSDRASGQITNPGMYNKRDFLDMIYAIGGFSERSLPDDEEESLKAERYELRALEKRLIKKAERFNIGDSALSIISPTADTMARSKAVKALDALTKEISELRKNRNRLFSRMKKNEVTLSELRSLNRNISVGNLICLNCNSEQIGLKLADSKTIFDITTPELRSQIITSLEEKISSYAEEITLTDEKIKRKQTLFSNLTHENDVLIEDVLLYRDDYEDMASIDDELSRTTRRLNEIDSILKTNRPRDNELQTQRKEYMDDIIGLMNSAHYRLSLGESIAEYASLFTTKAEALTGSELTEYALSRSFALAVKTQHNYPIVIDSFRAEDLSTAREKKALSLFHELTNQIIFSTTIKDEEHDKYSSFEYVNAIDYSSFETNKILQPSYLSDFLKTLASFGIVVQSQ